MWQVLVILQVSNLNLGGSRNTSVTLRLANKLSLAANVQWLALQEH